MVKALLLWWVCVVFCNLVFDLFGGSLLLRYALSGFQFGTFIGLIVGVLWRDET